MRKKENSWSWILSIIHFLCGVFLSGNPKIEPLSWNTRIKIAIGAARGLAFLHDSEKQVIYRDFKASNILLDGVSYFLFVQVLCCLP